MNPEPRPRPQVNMHVNSHEDEKHLIDYLRVLYKRRWVAIPAFLVILVVGVINTYRTTPTTRMRRNAGMATQRRLYSTRR